MLRDIFTNRSSSRAGSRLEEAALFHPPILLSTLILGLTLLGILSLWSGTSRAASLTPHASPAGGLPRELGTIVYQKNPDHPQQVFIIGNSHRSSTSGKNGSQTVPAQVETYRIAEWLILQHQVELLLPEGFFGRQERTEII
ncbi:MAG: hypothetical protein Q7U44_11530, partial [Desulfuromonadales bacterium]|nr:hypothetical protein [Desulfuromonadales bacterium]